MPTAFQIFAVERFPESARFKTDEQLQMEWESEHNLEPTVTSVERASNNLPFKLTRYDSEHDFLFQLQYPGRAKGMSFREFITPYKFPIFLGDHDKEIGFRPLLVRTKKKVAGDFVQRLNKHIREFDVRPIRMDFILLRPRIEMIRGAWFGAMRQPNLRSTGVFGHHVDQSEEFQHAESVGELRNLQIEIVQDDVTHTVMLGADGGFVLYNAYRTHEEEIEVVYPSLRGLLNGCLSPQEFTK